MNAHLIWSAHKRMVAVSDDPIAYLGPDGDISGVLTIMFCRQPDGPLYACHQQ